MGRGGISKTYASNYAVSLLYDLEQNGHIFQKKIMCLKCLADWMQKDKGTIS